MATPLSHLLLFLLLAYLLLPTAAAAAAAASHSHLHHHHRHISPSLTATSRIYTAPSMHQNHIDSQTRQSLRVLDPFSPVAAEAPSGEEAMEAMGAAAAEVEATRLGLPQAPSPPPPSFVASADPPSLAPPQPQPESEAAVPPPPVDETAAVPPPPVDETAATTTLLPLPTPTPYSDAASAPPPVHAAASGMVPAGDDLGLQQLAKVLSSLGYNEMASAAMLLAESTSITAWPGAITVFAAPDVLLQASCVGCSRRQLLLDHMALGYFPYAELAAAPSVKLPSASVGFCLDVVAQRGPFSVHHATLYVDGVEVSHPELYDDGRYVVHGLHGFVPPLSHVSCGEGPHHHHQVDLIRRRHHHHLSARSATTSAATAASVVRIMIRDAISRLRDGGFGFVALAMRVKFVELEKLPNMTVFALDDQAIFRGGGHGYVTAVRFHIIPGNRLTRADLLRLRPGTVLPTLAGEEHNLVITHGAGSANDEIRINYIPVKEPDAVINSRVAVHGIYVPFPHLHLANLAASVAVPSAIQTNSTCGVFGDCASTVMASATIPADQGYGEGQ